MTPSPEDFADLLHLRAALYPPEAVSTAALFIASALGGNNILMLEQFNNWHAELQTLAPDEAARRVIGLLSSLSAMAACACVDALPDDPSEELRACTAFLEYVRAGQDVLDASGA